MEIAVENGIDEVIAECGGSMICGTCHVYVVSEGDDTFDPPTSEEADLLLFGEDIRRPTSRLGCQLRVRPSSGSIVIELPSEQP
jgi:2Fe-2S ferredoxin